MGFAEDLQDDRDRENEERAEWASQGYVDTPCPKCGRQRVEQCVNGKHWCEK